MKEEGAGIWGYKWRGDSSSVLPSELNVWVWNEWKVLFWFLNPVSCYRQGGSRMTAVGWEGWLTCKVLPTSFPAKLASSPRAIFLVWSQFTPNMEEWLFSLYLLLW